MSKPASTWDRRQLLGALGGFASLPLSARAAAPSVHLVSIADGVYAFQGLHALMTPDNAGAICNVGVVVGGEAVAVIDSGGSLVEANALVTAIRATTDRPIRYLINTHMHPDHIFGNAVFKQHGATIVGHKNLPRALEARGAFYLDSYRRQLGDELMQGVAIVAPDETVETTRQIDLGGRTLELRAWAAAHTDNDLTVMDTASRTLFAGDLVFMQHLPTLDGSLLGWMRQMNELAALPASRVVPGHGPAFADWPEALTEERRYFDVLAGDLRKAIKDGVPMAQAVTTAAKSERDKWALFDDYNERNATAAYAELEWE